MSEYELVTGAFIHTTPAGAYYAACNSGNDGARRVIRHLLSQPGSPKADRDFLDSLSAATDITEPEPLLHHLQSMKYLDGSEQEAFEPAGAIEQLVEESIAALSSRGKAILTDDQGFYIAATGFPHETTGELAALAAQLGEVYARRRPVLNENLGLETAALALVDAAGNSEIGFWPLYIGATRFSLIVQGVPKFNQDAFLRLTWMLTRRYGTDAVSGAMAPSRRNP